MARQLLKLGGRVTVYDVNPVPLKELAAAGAKVAEAPAQLAGACEVIGLCVRDDADVERAAAWRRRPAGQREARQRSSPFTARSRGTPCCAGRQDGGNRGIRIIDAPITGGAAGAEAGTLAYMVGGETAVLER